MLQNLSAWHLILIVVMIGLLLLVVSAIVSISRADYKSGTEQAIWILIVLIAPLFGALIWFAVGRQKRLT